MILADNIPSAVTPGELKTLCFHAEGKKVLELGVDYGRSTIALGSVAAELHSVDWFQGDQQAGERNALPAAYANLIQYGLIPKVSLHCGDFERILPIFSPGYFDLAFVDGAHDRDSVLRDARLVEPLIRAGGLLFFHDYGRFDVTKAVDELAQRWGCKVDSVEYLAWLVKP